MTLEDGPPAARTAALDARPTPPLQAPPAFHLLAKPTGAACNLDCKYCFFLSKDALYPESSFRMTDEVLAAYLRQLIESHRTPEVTVAWQGGEPTLMGLPFFERAVALAEQYRRPGQTIQHTLQTNGTRLDAEWAAFFKRHNFLVGLSLDGPRALHDAYRVDKGGRGTFDQVLAGWNLLREHGVETNLLCTVHAANGDHPLEVYRFFRDDLGARFLQFIPIVERVNEQTLPLANVGWGARAGGQRPLYRQAGHLVTDRSVGAEQYGRFLVAIFDEWARRDVGSVFVQTFDAALGSWVGQYSLCIFAPTCGDALALEHNGDLYSCDHYVEPDFRLGNIAELPMLEMVASEQQRAFGRDKQATLPRYCRECDVRFACNGECPRNRFIDTPDGEPGLNYLCAGYQIFFRHVRRPMEVMADLLRRGRAPAELMEWLRQEDRRREQAFARAGRNDPCPCGSGKKYKRCHAGPAAAAGAPRLPRPARA